MTQSSFLKPEIGAVATPSRGFVSLADEKLKLWHYSPVMLGEMFEEAEKTGEIPYPEEA